MNLFFAPEFRGCICRCLVRPAPRARVWAAILCLLALLPTDSFRSSALAAEKHFSRIASAKCAAVFVLPDVNGRSHALAAEKGRPVLVHFFATWCESCKAEFPTLQQFFLVRRDRLDLIAIDVGEVPGRVRRFLKETPVSFPVFLDADRAVSKAWAIDGLPSTVLLDADLKPVLVAKGERDWTVPGIGDEIDAALMNKTAAGGNDCPKEYTP